MADRRAGRIPHVRDSGGGTPRSRNSNGQWRAKRSDAGTERADSGSAVWVVAGGVLVLAAVFRALRP